MEERSHPTHKKVWLAGTTALVILSAFPFAFGLLIHDPVADQQPLFDASVIAFMSLMGGALAALIIGGQLSLCPKCRALMRRYREPGVHDEEIRFKCKTCCIIFDTGLKESRD